MSLYFAYGSNLDAVDRLAWCRDRGIGDFLGKAVGRAFLPDHELVFNYHSVSRGGGALNLRGRRGQVTPGVLYELAEGGREWLDAKEGAPHRYRAKDFTVLDSEGRDFQAFTYQVTPEHRREVFVAPTESYRELVGRGLESHGLVRTMLDAVALGREAPFLVPRLFVYGTLLPGELAAHFWEGEKVRFERGRCRGQLFHLGRYPGLCLEEKDDDWVEGELAYLGDPDSLLRSLDRYEDFAGYGVPGCEYLRCLSFIEGFGGRQLAWVYRLLEQLTGEQPRPGVWRIPSGDWRRM